MEQYVHDIRRRAQRRTIYYELIRHKYFEHSRMSVSAFFPMVAHNFCKSKKRP